MLGADVLMAQALGFFGAIGQDALGVVAQRQIDRSRNLFPDSGMSFDLFANGFNRGMRSQKTVCQGLVFPKQSQQQVLGLYERTAKLAGLIAREKNDSSSFFR